MIQNGDLLGSITGEKYPESTHSEYIRPSTKDASYDLAISPLSEGINYSLTI